MTKPLQCFNIMFKDEAPAIGSGMRFVFAKFGRKWVYLLSPYSLKSCRISLKTWTDLKVTAITNRAVTERVRRELASRLHKEATRLQTLAIGGKP